MADQKISALTGATTPLAGTEVLPIVQSSTTVKVSVANLTAGRDVSATSVATGLGLVGTPSYTFTGDLNTGMWSPAADTVAISTAGSERIRATSNGNLLVGTSTAGAGVGYDVRLAVDGGAAEGGIFKTSAGVNAYSLISWNTATTGNNLFVQFGTEGSLTTRGSITYNRGLGQVAYNITSDERLKSNILDAEDASAKLEAVKVRQFNWKETGNHVTHGFIAQELDLVCPEAVTKFDDENEMWSVDYSKLVPILVKEVQSLRARVAQLEQP
jgi:hypothetical protein